MGQYRRPRGLASHHGLLIGVSAAAITACAKIGEDVLDEESGPFDHAIRDWVLAHQLPALERMYLVITHVGAPRVVIPASALGALWLWRHRLPIAGATILAPALAMALYLGIKRVYARQRPAGGARLHHRSYAFPSGHATTAAAVFGIAAYVLWRERMVPPRVAVAVASLPPALIGTSRVYLDVHWSTDVLGGWSMGGLVAALSGAVYEQVRRDTRLGR